MPIASVVSSNNKKNNNMSRPRIFIGSSTEGLDVANAIHQNLEHYAEVTIWTHGVFQLSTPAIISLTNSISIYNYAIFVFTPDDITSLRDNSVLTVRDNVIFETGLFIGKLGIDKVFFIKPRNNSNLHLPTDLLGMIAGEYDNNRSDNNLIAATGPFCNQVKQKINSLGLIETKAINSEATNSVSDLENYMQILFTYMNEKGWTSMSFAKITENVHPKLSEEFLMYLVETYPKVIRRCRIKNGVFGVKLIKT